MKKRIKHLMQLLTTAFILLSATSVIAQSLTVTLTPSNYNGVNISCFGSRDGSILATATGGTPPYNYEWSNGDVTATISNLAAGYYNVRVSDASGYGAGAEITLTQPEALRAVELLPFVYPNGYNTSAYNSCNGTVTYNLVGGAAPFTYLWRPGGQTVAVPTNLCANEHVLLITDVNGCHFEGRVSINQPDRSDWTMTGNANSNPATQFIGTNDNKDFVFKTNSIERARIKSSGELNLSSLSGSGYNVVMADPNGKLVRTSSISGIPECHLPWEMCGNYIGVIPTAFVGTNDNYDLLFKTNANGGGGENMRIKTNGKVGIGTSNPSQKLEVAHNDGAGIAGGMLLNNLSTTNKNSEIKFSQGNTNLWSIGNDVAHNNSQNFFIYDNVTSSGFGATRFLIDANGNTGIGTGNPSEKLQVTDGSVYVQGENQGLIIDAQANKRIGLIKYSGKEAGIWRVANQSFEIGRVNVSSLPGSPSNFSTDLFINGNGNIGVGNTNPSEKLEVSGKGKFTDLQATSLSGNTGKLIQLDANGNLQASFVSSASVGQWGANGTNIYRSSGKVFIGMSSCTNCTTVGYSLYVNDGIMTRDVKVTATTPFPDYVFEKKYKLMSLYELENYIKINKHLPDMPSAKEVEKSNGYEVGDMITKIVKQNEEQALYIIEQQKQIDELKASVKNLERRK